MQQLVLKWVILGSRPLEAFRLWTMMMWIVVFRHKLYPWGRWWCEFVVFRHKLLPLDGDDASCCLQAYVVPSGWWWCKLLPSGVSFSLRAMKMWVVFEHCVVFSRVMTLESLWGAQGNYGDCYRVHLQGQNIPLLFQPMACPTDGLLLYTREDNK